MDVDEFLSYDTRSRSEFLDKEWKKRGFLNVWLHRHLPFSMCVLHRIPRIDVRDDKETHQPKRMILTGNNVCIEDEDVFRNQYRRNRETGAREMPPQVCPPCLMIEWIHMEVIEGRMHWLQPIFDFDIGDPQRRLEIRATGLWNGYKPAKLNDQQKAEMEDAGISPMFGWKESIMAGVQYIMCVVDHDAPQKGVQIMREGQGLGDKLKLAISKEMRRNPRDKRKGDPVHNPYPFCFTYDEKKSPSEKYDAFPVDLEITEQIADLIDTDAPNIEMLGGGYSPGTLRAQLERAALIELPWDQFFTQEAEDILGAKAEAEPKPPAAPSGARRSLSAPTVQAPAQRAPVPPPRAAAAPPQRTAPPARAPLPARAPAPALPVTQELFACDTEGCAGVLAPTDAECTLCGAQYEVEAPAPPPPPPLRKRSELARAPQAQAERAPAPRAPAPAPRAAVAPPRAAAPVPATRGQVVAPRPAAPAPVARAAAPRPVAPRAAAVPAAEPSDAAEPPEGDDIGFGDFGEDQIPW